MISDQSQDEIDYICTLAKKCIENGIKEIKVERGACFAGNLRCIRMKFPVFERYADFEAPREQGKNEQEYDSAEALRNFKIDRK